MLEKNTIVCNVKQKLPKNMVQAIRNHVQWKGDLKTFCQLEKTELPSKNCYDK